MKVEWVRRGPSDVNPVWEPGTRWFVLLDGEVQVGRGQLTLSLLSSRRLGREIGPILSVDMIEVFEEFRWSVVPISTIFDFLSREAETLQRSFGIVGVAFDPINSRVIRFVRRNFRLVRIGEPNWYLIPLPSAD